MEPVTLHISCLNRNYYLQIKFPLDIIYLEADCEAYTDIFLLPSRTSLSKTVFPNAVGLKKQQMTLKYDQVTDFTIMQILPLKRLNNSEIENRITGVPEMKDVPIELLNKTLQKIDEDHPWLMPLYLKIIITIISTVTVISLVIICVWCCMNRGRQFLGHLSGKSKN